ncbi:Putative TRAP transporter small permease protein [Flagellimonas maritima]|uniref:TRAP transporter small permease protein n=1 Tax=Flagellimonas maritima TaxID=1383885 RepID=A0A2Z4LQK0_9FLAO|nr:TRAP transporter small permease [Allomuricauda aurantiaca]AWX43678.1 Putative TRAP transporter small permease protein [Allomuricauda aurantiaca]
MRLRKTIDKVLANILVIIMALMVLNVLWQVGSRFILGSPSSFTDELARYLLIWVGILGAAYISGQNMHVAIDVFPRRLGPTAQKWLKVIVRLLVIVFCLAAMVVGGSRLVYITYALGQNSPALQVPLAVVYMVIPISGLLIIYYKISDIIKKQ